MKKQPNPSMKLTRTSRCDLSKFPSSWRLARAVHPDRRAACARLMKQSRVIWLVVVSFALLLTVSGQGFVNLNFENAHVPPTPVGTYGNFVDPALAFPGWTVLPNGSTYPTSTFYNDLSLGGPGIGLMGPDFPNRPGYAPLEGSYSVLLQYFGIGNPPALSQTGLIPASAQSISILLGGTIFAGGMVVTLNGVNIPLVAIGNGHVGGDISGFAGDTAQLTISTFNSATVNSPDWVYFDNIQFSSAAVPEPSILSLFSFCTLFLCWRNRRASFPLGTLRAFDYRVYASPAFPAAEGEAQRSA